MRCSRARYFARYVSVSDCASVTNDDVNIAAVVSPDDDAADQAERSQATQSSKAASAARPDEAARAASSLRGGDSTAEGAGVSGSLEEEIYNSKVKEERLEIALTAAKARLAELEIVAEQENTRNWQTCWILQKICGLRPCHRVKLKFRAIPLQVRICILWHGLTTVSFQTFHRLIVHG